LLALANARTFASARWMKSGAITAPRSLVYRPRRMTLAAFVQPVGLAALVGWCFLVLSAAQLTIRLIMAFSVRKTFLAALVLCAFSLVVAAMEDVLLGSAPTLSARIHYMPVAMLLMALAGYATGRWVLRFRRVRGQIICGLMVGLLDPHLLTLIVS
jgi:hypothetical protein